MFACVFEVYLGITKTAQDTEGRCAQTFTHTDVREKKKIVREMNERAAERTTRNFRWPRQKLRLDTH